MVVESVTRDFDRFNVLKKDMPEGLLHQVARRRGLDGRSLPEISEVSWNEIEATLENIDPRKDHRRALDAVVQRSIDLYDDRSYDLIVANVPYDISEYEEEDSFGRKPKGDRWYQGEFDVLLVDIDNRTLREIEVKPRKGLPLDHNGEPVFEAPPHAQKARKQLERHAFAVDLLNDKLEGFDWKYIGEGDVVYEPDLHYEFEVPDSHTGSHYWTQEALEKACGSEEFKRLRETLVPGRYVSLRPDDVIEVEYEGRDIDFV